MNPEEVTEGETSFLVPAKSLEGVPSTDREVFYNPEMKLNRDLTALAVKRHVDRWGSEVTYLDAMAGTGARGLRVANEAGPRVVINDRSQTAIDLVERNLERAGLEAEVTGRDANALLSERGFDVIDVDPFGSPAPFTDAAARSIHMHGMLCTTATDTAPLCGAHLDAGRRRYDAEPLNGEHEKEVGARILLGHLARTLARYDKAAKPLATLYNRHYFRIFVEADRGAGRADAARENLGLLLHCPDCRRNEFTHGVFNERECRCGAERVHAGPLWTGPLHDTGFLNDLADLNRDEKTGELLQTLRDEAEGPPLYYSTNLTASRAKTGPPPIREFVEALRDEGYAATRTHFDPEAVKTDAPPGEQEELMSGLAG